MINQLAVPGVKCLEDSVLYILDSALGQPGRFFLHHCRSCATATACAKGGLQFSTQYMNVICSQASSSPPSLLHRLRAAHFNLFSHASMHSRKWKFPCSGSDLPQKNESDQFATYFMPLKRKEKTQTNQTNSFSVSNTESEL